MSTTENTLTLREGLTRLAHYYSVGRLDNCKAAVWAPQNENSAYVGVEIGMTTLHMTPEAAQELGKHLQAAALAMTEGGAA
mgnify:CR=1 FL=1